MKKKLAIWQYSLAESWDPRYLPTVCDHWVDFPPTANELTEARLHENADHARLRSPDGAYSIDIVFSRWHQRSVNRYTGRTVYRKVRRVLVLE